jgi:hypothetical protein
MTEKRVRELVRHRMFSRRVDSRSLPVDSRSTPDLTSRLLDEEGVLGFGGLAKSEWSRMECLEHKHLPSRRADGRLRILQLTDIHQFPLGTTFWTNGRGRRVDLRAEGYSAERNTALVATLAATVDPDLVIFTGDIIDGRPFGALASGAGKHSWRPAFEGLIAPLQASTPPIPWTFCPGNHDDDDSPWDRADLLEIFRLPGCLTPEAQSFDHTLTVGLGPTADSAPSVRLWLFDSGGNDSHTRYGTFQPATVASIKAHARSTTRPAS